MTDVGLLVHRLEGNGFEVASVRVATGGVVALAGLATLRDGSEVFAKTLREPGSDVFQVEAEGLRALTDLGGVTTPVVLAVAPNLLVLAPLQPWRDDESSWERLGHAMAGLHQSTVHDRFGWHRDGWLGRMRQENTWESDGHLFFAQRRVLRWLGEPLVEKALSREDRRAVESLCAALPELIPPQPPALTHGDLWSGNVLSDATGTPVLIDPAVSYAWPEIDLSMLWCSPRPPAADRFFEAYAEVAGLVAGWRDRMPVLHLRELLSVIAHGDDDWGAADLVRQIVAPFGRRTRDGSPTSASV
jgi:fructosamine-3-kinase